MKIKALFNKIHQSQIFIPGFLLVLSLAAYGWLVIQPGIYGDDPQILYAFHRYGLAGYQRALGWSRPFGAWVYTPLYALFGDHPALWQLGAILLRTLSAWLLYRLLRRVKHEWQTPALWAAAACLLYPGFSQQAHALQFSLHWAALCASLASQNLMLRALELKTKRQVLLTSALAVLLGGLGIFSTEYFVGLELLRFFILWIYLQSKREDAFQAAFIRWLPYLSIVLAFSIWCIFAADIAYPRPLLLDDLKLDAPAALENLLARIPADLLHSAGRVWEKIFTLQSASMDARIYVGAGIVSTAIIWLVMRQSAAGDPKTNTKTSLFLTGTGLAVMLVSGLPLWISQTPLALSFPENRATLCLMVGACLTLAGCAGSLRQAGPLVVSILLGFSLAFQLNTCVGYTQTWELLRSFFNQLANCAPGLESCTLILYEEPFIPSYPANSFSALLNWTYDPENHNERLSYDMLRVGERLGNNLPALTPDLPVQHGTFQGNTSQTLVVMLDAQPCLRFLFPGTDNTEGIDPLLLQASRISNPGVIIHNPIQPAQLPAFIESIHVNCSCE